MASSSKQTAPGSSRGAKKASPTFEMINGEMVELTKAGTISRMRSHRGNKPAIPQNHVCHLCPAKFTRPTHLHRHLRTHSSSRSHKCDKCGREFTRSDLLTRHKRSCGDPTLANRTRRKSCQACADGKTKCDLQQPCSRCVMRGCECTYVRRPSVKQENNELESPSNPVYSKSPESSPEVPREGEDDVKPKPELISPRFPVSDLPPAFASSSSAPALSGPSILSSSSYTSPVQYMPPSSTFQDFRDHTTYASSAASTSYAPSVSGYSESVSAFPPSFAGMSGGTFAKEAYKVNNELNALFSVEFFDKFFHDYLDDSRSNVSGSQVQVSPVDAYGYQFDSSSQFPFSLEPVEEVQPFMGSMPLDPQMLDELCQPTPDEFKMNQTWLGAPDAIPRPVVTPYPSEFQHYMHLFYQMFLHQMPIVHIGTFTIEGKPQVLLSAMQACGALYVKTTAAMNFIDDTLSSAREQLMSEFAKKSATTEHQMHLVLAVVLLQTIGLFHRRPDQRTHSNFYHGMLVTMIRQAGLIQMVTNWSPPVVTGKCSLDGLWRDWAFHETTKRALLLAYLHDCCHCIYFTLRPNFARDEMTVPLPCEDELFRASTAEEWYGVLQRQSRYGGQTLRFRPPGLQEALTFLGEMSEDEDVEPPMLVTPFAHFVLAHAILRKLFDDCIEKPAGTGPDDGEPTAESLAVQYMLHKWLKSWLHSPETPTYSDVEEPRFLFDALPFYWIAQVALLAYQEKLPPFATPAHIGSGAGAALGEAKFRLVKEWLRHIRQFLRKGEQGPTLFWDELTKIRMKSAGRGSYSDTESIGTVSDVSDGPGGLLGFFAGET